MIARTRSRRLALVGVAVALALAAAGCGGSASTKKGGGNSSASASATPDLGLADGVKLTKEGSDLAFGDTATVGFEPNDQKATGLDLTVISVQRGSIRDLAAYKLDPRSAKSTPYYATVKVANVGKTDIGRSAVPLWGLSSDNTLIGASAFTNTFTRCKSGPLPATFAAGASTTTCLMYLVPKGATLAGVSFRPVMSQEPIVWKGKITVSKPGHKKPGKKKPAA